MRLSPITTRADKGAPISAAEHDKNLLTFRDGINALMALWGVVFNPNGTIRDGKVGSNAIADRAVTQRKLDWFANFYVQATGSNTYVASILPNPGAPHIVDGEEVATDFAYGDGIATAFIVPVKFELENTGPSTLNINGAGAKPLLKFGIHELASGDIVAGQIYWAAYDGTSFQLVGQLGSGVDRSELGIAQKRVHVVDTVDSTSEVIPSDNTIPQSTEGKEYTTFSFTPKFNVSRLLIEFSANFATSGSGGEMACVALFKDDEADALAASASRRNGGSALLRIVHDMVSPGTDPITFKIRFGSNNGDSAKINVNIYDGSNMGGAMRTTLIVTEYIEG